MPIVSQCPKCQQAVTIPDGVAADAPVRCPLCETEYPLRAAMAGLPPALIPVQAVTPPAGAIPSADEFAPLAGAIPSADEFAPPAGAEEAAEAGAAIEDWAELESEAAMRLDSDAAADAWATAAAEEAAAEGLTAEAPAEGLEAESFAFVTGEKKAAERPAEEGAAAKPRPKPRRPRKQKSMLREMVGAVVGGFFGLAIGYYILNFFGGPRFDFIEIYLPGVPHTYKHRSGAESDKTSQGGANVKKASSDKRDRSPSPTTPPAANPSQPAGTEPPEETTLLTSTLPADYVGPRNPPSFTSDQLGAALKDAHESFGCPKCNSKGFLMKPGGKVVCDACKGKPPQTVTAEAYQKFCRLAEVLTFVDQTDAAQLAGRKQAVQNLLETVAAAPGQLDQLGFLAATLVENEDTAQGGILVAGAVRQMGTQGSLHGASVLLAGTDSKLVSLMGGQPLGVGKDDRVMILGSLVRDPAENMIGYTGKKKLVVWDGLTMKLPPE